MIWSDFIVLALGALSVAFGLWIFLEPLKMFEIQRKFYAAINWKIEPISLEKEIRNTKLMGIFLIVFAVAICGYAVFCQ